MTQMNMIQALNAAQDLLLERDPNVLIFGQDVGYFGGVFRSTDGLQAKHGLQRVFDSPITEAGIVAMATGMAANGLRPIAEIQFADYIFPGFDQIISELSRLRYRSAGQYYAPVTIRSPWGGGIRGGQTHSQSPEAFFTHIPGVKVVVPCTPHDAKGLLISAVEDDDPVIFFEPKRLYNGPFDGDYQGSAKSWAQHPGGEVPDGHYTIPLGKAKVVRVGQEATIVTYGTMVHVAQAAVEKAGIDAEIIDLRTLVPLDLDTITWSVEKTGKCVIVHEAPKTSGFGAELSAAVQEECFWHLQSPIQRVTGWDTHYPHAHEWEYFPSQERIIKALQTVMKV